MTVRLLVSGFTLLAACANLAPKHEFAIEPGQEGAPGAATVVLAPMNAFSQVPHELEEGRSRSLRQPAATSRSTGSRSRRYRSSSSVGSPEGTVLLFPDEQALNQRPDPGMMPLQSTTNFERTGWRARNRSPSAAALINALF